VLVLLLSLGYLLKISSGRNSEMARRLASVTPALCESSPIPPPPNNPIPHTHVPQPPQLSTVNEAPLILEVVESENNDSAKEDDENKSSGSSDSSSEESEMTPVVIVSRVSRRRLT
jgi:hypothetical protein